MLRADGAAWQSRRGVGDHRGRGKQRARSPRPACWAARTPLRRPSTPRPSETSPGRHDPGAVPHPHRPSRPAVGGAPPQRSMRLTADAHEPACPRSAAPCPHRPRPRVGYCMAALAATPSAQPQGGRCPWVVGFRRRAAQEVMARASPAPARASRLPSALPPATPTAVEASCGLSSWWRPPGPRRRGPGVRQVLRPPRVPPRSS